MLRELHISNLAVITDVRIELDPALNCFTGATGAGKSLVIGALELLLGLRSPAEMLRPGAEEGRVSGVFELRDPKLAAEIARAGDVDLGNDGNEILLTRRLYASGRSSVSLNGNPITLSMLKNVAECLVDIHGQHDQQFLLKPANQLDVLDEFGGLLPLRGRYAEVYRQLAETRQRLEDLASGDQLRKQQLDLYTFQAEEIDKAELDAAEYPELQSRAAVLRNVERLKRDAAAAHEALYESDSAIVERLRGIIGVLSESATLDDKLKNVAQTIRDATIQLEEASYDLSRYLDRLDVDPGELAEVEDRLNTIHRTLNKYGESVETVLAYREEIGTKIAELQKDAADSGSLDKLIAPLSRDLAKLGGELTESRQKTAAKLAPLIEKQLTELGMEKAKFTVSLTPAAPSIPGVDLPAQPSGFDALEFIMQTNPGQLAQPLRKIASGGEMSRVMLALKGILAASDRVSVLVFDEIDSNVGGRLGSVIGAKLRDLGTHHQVLCITHLPQIACFADRHLTVRKEVTGNTTHTTVRAMEGEERLHELAEMIGGAQITPTTLAQVQELLAAASRTTATKRKAGSQRLP
jgi:DNA repair protein RecN (Recombination protein N)